jgi:hypothetical protein
MIPLLKSAMGKNVNISNYEHTSLDSAMWTVRCGGIVAVINLNEKEVHDEDVKALANVCGVHLRHLSIDGTHVGDEGMKYVADKCPALEYVSCNHCWTITDEGVMALARKCRGNLKAVFVGYTQVRCRGVAALANECPNLETVEINARPMDDDEAAVRTLADNCTKLTLLTIHGNGMWNSERCPIVHLLCNLRHELEIILDCWSFQFDKGTKKVDSMFLLPDPPPPHILPSTPMPDTPPAGYAQGWNESYAYSEDPDWLQEELEAYSQEPIPDWLQEESCFDPEGEDGMSTPW